MLGQDVVDAAFEDPRTAPVSDACRAMLLFLETMTQRPAELGAADAEALRAAGVTRAMADDAVMVGFVFNMIVRVADALDFDIPTPEQFAVQAKFLLKRGYA